MNKNDRGKSCKIENWIIKVLYAIIGVMLFFALAFWFFFGSFFFPGKEIRRLREQAINIGKDWKKYEFGMSADKFIAFYGDSCAKISYSDNSIILYYKSAHTISGVSDLQALKKMNGRNLPRGCIVEIYDYITFYFGPNGGLEAYTQHGESLYVHSVYGDIEHSSLIGYFDKKQEEDFKKIHINKDNKSKMLELFSGCDEKVKIKSTCLYSYYKYQQCRFDRNLKKQFIPARKKGYSFLIDNKERIIGKIDWLNNLCYLEDDTIIGKSKINEYLFNENSK